MKLPADVSDPIYLALATSKVEQYEKVAQFKHVVIVIAAGEYPCWPVRTAIPFRADPVGILRAKLEHQFIDQRLSFVGTLTDFHLLTINEIVTSSPFVRPNLKPFLLP